MQGIIGWYFILIGFHWEAQGIWWLLSKCFEFLVFPNTTQSKSNKIKVFLAFPKKYKYFWWSSARQRVQAATWEARDHGQLRNLWKTLFEEMQGIIGCYWILIWFYWETQESWSCLPKSIELLMFPNKIQSKSNNIKLFHTINKNMFDGFRELWPRGSQTASQNHWWA